MPFPALSPREMADPLPRRRELSGGFLQGLYLKKRSFIIHYFLRNFSMSIFIELQIIMIIPRDVARFCVLLDNEAF